MDRPVEVSTNRKKENQKEINVCSLDLIGFINDLLILPSITADRNRQKTTADFVNLKAWSNRKNEWIVDERSGLEEQDILSDDTHFTFRWDANHTWTHVGISNQCKYVRISTIFHRLNIAVLRIMIENALEILTREKVFTTIHELNSVEPWIHDQKSVRISNAWKFTLLLTRKTEQYSLKLSTWKCVNTRKRVRKWTSVNMRWDFNEN